jgi:hypothetical protein
LYVFFVLSLERRRVLHVNVTKHPTAEWAAQQIVEAVAPDEGLERLIRDGVLGERPSDQRGSGPNGEQTATDGPSQRGRWRVCRGRRSRLVG